MQTHSDPQKVTGKAAADNVSGKGASLPAQATPGLQEMIDNSETVKQFRMYQAMADAHASSVSKKQHPARTSLKPILRKKTGNILSPVSTAFGAVVQTKRSRPADAELANMVGEGKVLNEEFGTATAGIPEGETKKRADAVWPFLDAKYTSSLTRGRRLYADLQAKITEYKKPTKKAGIVEELKKKDAKNEDIFNSSYASTSHVGASGDYLMETAGKEVKKGEDRFDEFEAVRKKKDRKIDYENTVNPSKGKITANQNFNNRDFAKFQPKGPLNNSEILWNQYRMAAKEAATTSGSGGEKKTDPAKVAADLKKLEQITREHVLNEETLAAIYLTGPNGSKIGAKRAFAPGSDEFLALLGTPNGNSSAYILMDHLHDVEKNLDSIATGGTDTNIDMNIKFKKI